MNAKSMNAKSMHDKPTLPTTTDVQVMRKVISRSPIRALPAPRLQAVFTDWLKERHSAEVDELILSWIASHVPTSTQRGRRLH